MRKSDTLQVMLPVLCAAAMAGCSVNGSQPVTAWGKSGVSMIDYRTDGAECALLAVTYQDGTNGANSAGGVNGQNSNLPDQRPSGQAIASSMDPRNSGSNGTISPVASGNTYSQTATVDAANRAAMQQRAQEMAEQRARNDALKSCLVKRGYTEFALDAAQRSALAKLPQGSEERREYLYKLGSDPQVIGNQAVSKPPAPPVPGR